VTANWRPMPRYRLSCPAFCNLERAVFAAFPLPQGYTD
jgi:hypothetical protein